MVMAWASLMRRKFGTFRMYMGATILLGAVFLVVKYFEYSHHFAIGEGPSHSNFLAIYYTLTGLHMLHVFGGMVVNAYFWGPGSKLYADESGVVHEPGRALGPVLALRRSRLDLPVSNAVSSVGASMSSDHGATSDHATTPVTTRLTSTGTSRSTSPSSSR